MNMTSSSRARLVRLAASHTNREPRTDHNNKKELTYLPFLPPVIVQVSYERKKTILNSQNCELFFYIVALKS